MGFPTFDICTIVKNESSNLKLTLPNKAACADRVIIIDTGSTDDTKQTALSLGAEVYDFKWINDFSAARNFSISKADSDWIMWLDADEYMEKEDFEKIRKTISETDLDIIYVPICECLHGTKEVKKAYFRDKIFRNIPGARFERKVNEQLVLPGHVRKGKLEDVKIYHWGAYAPEEIMKEKTLKRIDIFKLAIEKTPEDPYLHYMLCTLYQRIKMYGEALDSASAALSLRPEKDLEFALRFKLYEIYEAQGRPAEAVEEARRCLELDGDYAEPYCAVAFYLIKESRFEEARVLLEKAAALTKKSHPVVGQNNYYWDYLRHFYYGMALLKTGRPKEAIPYYKKILEIAPNRQVVENIIKGLESLSGGV